MRGMAGSFSRRSVSKPCLGLQGPPPLQARAGSPAHQLKVKSSWVQADCVAIDTTSTSRPALVSLKPRAGRGRWALWEVRAIEGAGGENA